MILFGVFFSQLKKCLNVSFFFKRSFSFLKFFIVLAMVFGRFFWRLCIRLCDRRIFALVPFLRVLLGIILITRAFKGVLFGGF